jgi:hypothetical protein
VEGVFSELRRHGVLRSSLYFLCALSFRGGT